ncbi:MAG: D-glycero-beta-D-manno-heptose 1,7-bisphosphate 7-phosphatase [Candidatus Saganbacteria bacterium]|nr:D-glycero-beta-D-manno-heptose 1,7-bisphosphate 7-phosphatase [Candidatus Saganbacteria bacterium]
MHKAVFLDKDGTINEDLGYINDPRDLKLIPGSAEAIKMLNDAGYKVIVISNQSGIARGYIQENMIQTLNKILHKHILNGGGHVDSIYYCPHHPEIGLHPYKKNCDCRKPSPGMLKRGAKEHGIDLSQSYMIGDRVSDIEAGKNAGCKTILTLTGYGKEEQKALHEKQITPDHVAKDLLEAVKWVLSNDRNS